MSNAFDDLVTELGQRNSGRRFMLQRLHSDRINHFVNNPGFGVARMVMDTKEVDYYLPKREPILQPNRPVTSQSRPAVDHPVTPLPEKVSAYHQDSVVEFAYPTGWGWERKPNEFLGFQPHQMGKKSKHEHADREWSPDVHDGWKVASVELIGLLARPKPTVYMTDHLPQMDEAKAAPTRDPDEFEEAGLKAIADGHELYLGKARTEPVKRMVGGIRAAKACMNCHGCREGELLGAFSYTLTK